MLNKIIHYHGYQKLLLLLVLNLICSCAAGFNTQAAISEADRFSDEINTFIQEDKKNGYAQNALLFVGSSSIRLWNTALSFPNLQVINRGFGGSEISDINYYYEHVVKKYKPAKIIFYAGDNDIAAGKTAEQVLRDYQIFIEKVKQDCPRSQVFYLPIKPSLRRWKLWPEMSDANALIKEFIKTKPNLFFVDIASAMLNKKLEPNPALFMDDGLHLNDKGYQLWKEILSPYIE